MKTYFISNKINFNEESASKKTLIESVCSHIRNTMNGYGFKEANEDDLTIDYIFSIGGDGTMMHTMNKFLGRGAVIIGINAGNVGFLTPYTIFSVFDEELYDSIISKSARIEGRSILQYEYKGKTVKAVNEYAFSGADSNLIIDYSIETRSVNHKSLAGHYKANNLLISGPCGSTAYNMNAGGAILDPSIKAMQVLMIAPTTMGIRPMIFPDKIDIVVRFKSKTRVFTDGIETDSFDIGDSIKINILEDEAKILLPDDWNFYGALSDKLHWNNGKKV